MTNQGWKIKIAVLAVFLCSHAFAKSQIESEFELVLPKEFQKNLINEKWKSFAEKEFAKNWQFPNQTMTAQEGIPVQINDIFLEIKTRLKKPALQEAQTLVELTSQGLQAELRLGEVSVDHTIEREVGGIVGRFRLQALCKDVRLNMTAGQGEFAVLVAPTLASATAGGEIQAVRLGWTPQAWVISSMQCSGAQGFDDILRGEIQKLAQDSATLVSPHLEFIKQSVQAELDKIQIDLSGSRRLLVSRPDIEAHMIVDRFQDLGTQGLKVRGRFTVDFARVATNSQKKLTLAEGSTAGAANQASLRLPKDFLKEIVNQAYAPNTWRHSFLSPQIPGFVSLMRSRFIQFFVWPELMSYPKSSVFRFDVYSNKSLNIQGQGLQYKINTTIYTQMQSPQKAGQLAPFMNFTVPVTAQLGLQVQNGVLKVSLGSPQMGLQAQWDKNYLSSKRVSTGFSTSTIRSRIIESIAGEMVTVSLPTIPVADDLTLKIKKVRVNTTQDLIVDLGQ